MITLKVGSKEYWIAKGVEHKIPIAFEKYCQPSSQYSLHKIPPEDPSDEGLFPVFEIRDKDKQLLASFDPIGKYQCLNDDFKPIFELIKESLGHAAYRALKAQEMLDEKMDKEFADLLKSQEEKMKKL